MELQHVSLNKDALIQLLTDAHQKGSEDSITLGEMVEWITLQLQSASIETR